MIFLLPDWPKLSSGSDFSGVGSDFSDADDGLFSSNFSMGGGGGGVDLDLFGGFNFSLGGGVGGATLNLSSQMFEIKNFVGTFKDNLLARDSNPGVSTSIFW